MFRNPIDVAMPLSSATTDNTIKGTDNSCSSDGVDDHSPDACSESWYRPLERDEVSQLIDLARQKTGASYDNCGAALVAIMQTMSSMLPRLKPLSECITQHVASNTDAMLANGDECGKCDALTSNSPDFRRLRVIFDELIACCANSQQRNWETEDERPIITEYLRELRNILEGANTVVTRCAVTERRQAGAVALAQLYQMESGAVVRQCLARVLTLCCALSRHVIVRLLGDTSLPSELARELEVSLCGRDEEGVYRSARLLSALLSIAQPLPLTHSVLLSETFTDRLLECIECSGDSDSDQEAAGGCHSSWQLPDQLRQLLITLVLALNLQCEGAGGDGAVTDGDGASASSDSAGADNDVMGAGTVSRMSTVVRRLATRTTAKHLTESCLLLLNSGDDPVCVFEYHCADASHSVARLLADMLSVDGTARLFYTNDVLVLVDIVLRNLCNLSAGTRLRHEYLQLCWRLVRCHVYSQYRRRVDEFDDILRHICDEEPTHSRWQLPDHTLAKTILQYHHRHHQHQHQQQQQQQQH